MTRPTSRTASAGLSATRAPFLANGLHFAALRFQTVSLYPALRRLDAMPPPMVPRPRYETVFIIVNSSKIVSVRVFVISAAPLGEGRRRPGPRLAVPHQTSRV